MMVKHIVGVAEMKLAFKPGDVVVTHGLGSCLGITLHDPVAGVGGLLHVMMPTSSANPDKAKANPFMFVDTGLPAFLDALQKAGAVKGRCRLKVAGGAAVNEKDHFEIGKRNYIIFKKTLWKCGVLIDAEDVGGGTARTLYLQIGSGRVWLNKAGEEYDL
jgi:chemotaxis protein CheD